MSYDLLVFDPLSAPKDKVSFLEWYREETRWSEPHDYADIRVAPAPLRAWFLDIVAEFPPLNGPFAADDPDNDRVTEYSIGTKLIYAGFRWSVAEVARVNVIRLAEKHGVGFCDASAREGDVWVPTSEGLFEKLPRLATLDEARRARSLPVRVEPDGWTTCANCGRRFKVSDPGAFAEETHLRCSQRLKLIWPERSDP